MGITVGLILVGLIGAAFFGTSEHTIRLSEAYVQQKINEKLPKTDHGVMVKQATVHFEGDRVDLVFEVTGSRSMKSFALVAEAIGKPDYELSHNGEFFFLPEAVHILEFTYTGEDPQRFFDRFTERYVTNRRVKKALEDIAPHVEGWVTKAAEASAMVGLQHIPIYRLKDDNIGFFIRASLSRVDIQGNDLVITYSIWGLLKTILLGIVAVALMALVVLAPMGWRSGFLAGGGPSNRSKLARRISPGQS
jgi:hypothetical protein